MFPGEVEVEILPPGQDAIYVFTSVNSTSTGGTSDGVAGTITGRWIGESEGKAIVDLPGEVRPIGPRVYFPKQFVVTDK